MAKLRQHKQTFKSRMKERMDVMAFNWKVRQDLYRHLVAQTENGLSIEKALTSFRSRLRRKNKISSDEVIGNIIRRLKDGSTFANAIGQWIPNDEIGIIASGELAGDLGGALTLVIETKTCVNRVKISFRNSMISPLIYMVMTYGMLWAIGRYVIATFTDVLPASKTTGLVSVVYSLSDFANSIWAIFFPVLIVLFIYLIIWSLPKWTGKMRVYVERFPPFSFYRDINGYIWLMGFTALLRTGVADTEILKRQVKIASPWLKERLNSYLKNMDNGASLSVALLSKGKNLEIGFGFPNPEIVDVVSSLDGFSDFPIKIAVLARQWSEELEETMIAQGKVIGFVVEMLMYLMMGMLMIAINQMTSQIATVVGKF